MAGAVHVSIVTLLGLILDVSGVDRDATGLLFGRLVDLVIAHGLRAANLGQSHGDGRGQGGLAVVDVTDRADVYMRLIALKFCLCHWKFLPIIMMALFCMERVMGIEPT